jgi:hypothetical protein
MENINTDLLIREADRLIDTATEELQRSEEDVITHLICVNSRQSILNYLIAFLHRNGEELKKPVTMASLLDQCRALDGRFQLIDLTPINCRNKAQDDDYCLHVDKVAECLQIARQTQAITHDTSPAY